MNNKDNYQISALEMAISLLAVTPGIGFLIYPRVLTEAMNTADGWISIFICGFFCDGSRFSLYETTTEVPGSESA